jgi:tRNA pseudouridine synthase 10
MGGSSISTPLDFNKIVEDVEKTLSKYPLCDHCLGRLFAKYGVGLSNRERGSSLKTMIGFKLYDDYSSKRISRDSLLALAENAGEPLTRMVEKLFAENVNPKTCFICGGRISEEWLDSVAETVYEKLKEASVTRFIVGVKLGRDLREKELQLLTETGFTRAESLKNEIKREVGKKVMAKYGLVPDFEKPEATAIVKLDENFNYRVELVITPVLLKGVYNKRGRNISHVPWLTKQGGRKYPLSIQEYLESRLADPFKAKKVKIHAAGREDVDARTLGPGRPLVIEIVEPLTRSYDIEEVNKLIRSDLVEVRVHKPASRRDIELLKQTSREKRKVYRLLVVSSTPISEARLSELEAYFNDIAIQQRTPIRILTRKKDVLRVRKVYEVRTKPVSSTSFEALVYCDGGLYVKELVHCDQGRTNPCFASILNTELKPVELDVLYIEH